MGIVPTAIAAVIHHDDKAGSRTGDSKKTVARIEQSAHSLSPCRQLASQRHSSRLGPSTFRIAVLQPPPFVVTRPRRLFYCKVSFAQR